MPKPRRRRATGARKLALTWIDDNAGMLCGMSDEVWRLAEPAFEEHKSSALLADAVEAEGFRVERGVADMATAFVASYGSGKPVVGILAEYDALPGLSQKPVAHKQPLIEGGCGHGCGHNLLGVGSMGAAIAVSKALARTRARGTIRLFGCPAEEGGSGKTYMVRDGCFGDVDVVLHWHPGSRSRAMSYRTLAVKRGKFSFRGLSAHAAGGPEQGRSALDAVELMNIGVNYLREHTPEKSRLHYVITDGGQRPNIVPDFAESWYYVRAPTMQQVDQIWERVVDIARGAALMTRTEYQVHGINGSYDVLPNESLAKLIDRQLRRIGPPVFAEQEVAFARELQEAVAEGAASVERGGARQPRPTGTDDEAAALDTEVSAIEYGRHAGSTDVGDVSWLVPTGGLSVAARVLRTPGHSWPCTATSGTSIGHKGMLTAAKVLCATALELLSRPELVRAAKRDFAQHTTEFSYVSPIQEGQPPPERLC
jgi:aminobenzoyl-glutamate utilization protein B